MYIGKEHNIIRTLYLTDYADKELMRKAETLRPFIENNLKGI